LPRKRGKQASPNDYETLAALEQDKDRNLAKVGSLARDKPILLPIDTLRHKQQGVSAFSCSSAREETMQRHGHGRKGEYPRELKT